MEFRYGNNWERFSINMNEIWSAGRNRILCADMIKVQDIMLSTLFHYSKVDMVYCDPPYNQAMLSAFKTKAQYDEDMQLPDLYQALFEATRKFCTKVAFFECGLRSQTIFEEKLWFEFNHTAIQKWRIQYNNSNPAILYRIALNKTTSKTDYSEMDDKNIPAKAMETEKPMDVTDFCMGRGLTGRAAFKFGVPCYAVELNPRRIANLLSFYETKGLAPKKTNY